MFLIFSVNYFKICEFFLIETEDLLLSHHIEEVSDLEAFTEIPDVNVTIMTSW